MQDDATYTLFLVKNKNTTMQPIMVSIQINKATLDMEVDTGAASFIISEATYQHLWSEEQAPPLMQSQKKLCTYTKEMLEVKGVITVKMHYQGQTRVGSCCWN